MKKIGLFLLLLITLQTTAQIRVCQLPQTSTGTVHDWIIKEDSTCVGTRKITVQDFMTAYGITSSSSGSVASFSSGNLSPLFATSVANSTTNPALSFSLSSVAAHKWYGNATGSSGVPSFSSMDTTEIANFSSKVRGLFTGYSPVSYSNGGISVDTSAGGSHLATQYYVSQHSGSGTGDMTKAVYDPAGQEIQVLVTPFLNAKAIFSVDQIQAFDIYTFGVEAQTYIIDNSGVTPLPSGIERIVIKATTGSSGVIQWDNIVEAYVTSVQRYIICQYDVATNTIQGEYVLWAGYVTEVSGDPTVDATAINISGETPVLTQNSTGQYFITFTGGQLVSDTKCQTTSGSTFDGSTLFLYTGHFDSSNTFLIETYRVSDQAHRDSALNKTYIEIKINL